jgi:O-antigen ligase
LLNQTRHLGYLLVVPAVTFLVVRSHARASSLVLLLLVLAVIKAVEGAFLGAVPIGAAAAGVNPVFYNPASNWLLVTLLAGIAAAWVSRVHVPTVLLAAVPIAMIALLVSQRRGFWIALLAALVAVLLISVPRHRARVLAAVAATSLLLGAIWLTPVAAFDSAHERVATLSPAGIASSKEDRYRLTERRNVLATIAQQPVTGIGMGVPWEARRPMTVEYQGARYYAHIIVLFFWLKMGLVGVAAYLLVMGTALYYGMSASRRGATPLLRVAGLAFAASTLGLALAETTGSHTGSNLRHTIIFGVCLGLAASIRSMTDQTRNV